MRRLTLIEKVKAWEWQEKEKAEQLFNYIIQAINEALGPEASYHIRAQIKNPGQGIFETDEIAVVIEWQLIEIVSASRDHRVWKLG